MSSELRTKFLAEIDRQLDRDLSSARIRDPLGQAIRYMVFPAGKRIRPLLAMNVCQDLGVDPTTFVSFFTPLELLHVSSLIHDDLPALDNDDLRRGRPSCHKQFGEATAILAGDTLIGVALHAITRASCSTEVRLTFSQEISLAFINLCQGQQQDVLNIGGEAVLDTHALKTGALFGAACVAGALAAGKKEPIIGRARNLGIAIGIYFQSVDDALDQSAFCQEKGRVGGSDQRNNRHTIATDFTGDSAAKLLDSLRLEIDGALLELAQACDLNKPLTETLRLINELHPAK